MKGVSEYHRFMSIPALTTLGEIKINFQNIHINSIQTVQGVLLEHTDEKHGAYEELREKYDDSVTKYDSLTYSKNSRGEFLAPDMMQQKMQDYIKTYQEIIQKNDLVLEKFYNNEISESKAVSGLASIEIEFHKLIEKNSEMEILGIEEIQNKITSIEEEMQTVFLISIIVSIVSIIVLIIVITQFVSKPISNLVEVTREISKGKFTNVTKNSSNSDVNDIMVALNQMSKELENYKSKILMQEKLSSIGELASRLAHDIKNPLTVIKVTLDLLKAKNQNLSAEEIKKFERVDDAMYRITHQIDNVLDFIKGRPMKFVKHPIKKILDSVIDDLPKSNKISLEIISENSEIECDFEAMKVALINLIINAMQAIEDEGKIKITSKIREDKVIIQIEDSGPGVSKEILEKIFDPLYTTKQEGTGLGLASCKSIIEQHHGKISVKNNPTRFIIELPANIEE